MMTLMSKHLDFIRFQLIFNKLLVFYSNFINFSDYFNNFELLQKKSDQPPRFRCCTPIIFEVLFHTFAVIAKSGFCWFPIHLL